jgi:hypothetical protein
MCAEEAVQCQKAARSVKKRPRKDQSKMWGQFSDSVDTKAEDAADVQLAEPDESTLKVVAALAKEGQSHEAGAEECSWVRRSVRASGQSELSSRQVAELLGVIKSNHKDAVVLKLKHWLGPDTNTWVIDAVLSALMKNDNCEALYIQNFNDGTTLMLLFFFFLEFFLTSINICSFPSLGMLDPQLAMLSRVLRRGHIWCLNIGENYRISPRAWEQFAKALVHSNVTHMYASEHVISPELKTRFRDVIRNNRKKHRRHDSMWNLAVIERCTNMWWNPCQGRNIVNGLRARAVERGELLNAVPSTNAMPVEEACCAGVPAVAPSVPSSQVPVGCLEVKPEIIIEELKESVDEGSNPSGQIEVATSD